MRGDGGLVARVDIRTLVAVDLHRDKFFVDEGGDLGIVVAFAVHHMAPVAPHGANVEQDGLVFCFRGGEGLAPNSRQRTGWCMAERR